LKERGANNLDQLKRNRNNQVLSIRVPLQKVINLIESLYQNKTKQDTHI